MFSAIKQRMSSNNFQQNLYNIGKKLFSILSDSTSNYLLYSSVESIKWNDINLKNCPQMQNDTENEISRLLFPCCKSLRFLASDRAGWKKLF